MSMGLKEGVEVLRAAGEPSRLRIVALLAREELAVMELCQIMDQSQPRVSRHLRLLTASGLVERFPDGGWAFYRLTADPGRRAILDRVLPIVDEHDPSLARDRDRLAAVRAERGAKAQAYFERNAPLWDQLRSLYVSEADVEAAILAAAPEGPIGGLIDLGTGAGRMLTLLADRSWRPVENTSPCLSSQCCSPASATRMRAMFSIWCDRSRPRANLARPASAPGGLTVKIWAADRLKPKAG